MSNHVNELDNLVRSPAQMIPALQLWHWKSRRVAVFGSSLVDQAKHDSWWRGDGRRRMRSCENWWADCWVDPQVCREGWWSEHSGKARKLQVWEDWAQCVRVQVGSIRYVAWEVDGKVVDMGSQSCIALGCFLQYTRAVLAGKLAVWLGEYTSLLREIQTFQSLSSSNL